MRHLFDVFSWLCASFLFLPPNLSSHDVPISGLLSDSCSCSCWKFVVLSFVQIAHDFPYTFLFFFFLFALFLNQMAAFNIQEALIWKEKIELIIDQVQYVIILAISFCFLSDLIFIVIKRNNTQIFNKSCLDGLNMYIPVAASGVSGC